jgi:hypothetical protein
MKRLERSIQNKALRKTWRSWTETVELFARRRRARKRVDPQTYVKLHRELLEKCRALAAAANDVEAVFYRYLEDLAGPWLDPAVLSRADRDILFDLVLRCRQVDEQLGGRSWLRWLLSWRPFAPAAAVTFVIIVLWMGKISVLLRTSIDAVRGWAEDISYSITHSTDEQRWFVVACVVVAVSIYTASRTARS